MDADGQGAVTHVNVLRYERVPGDTPPHLLDTGEGVTGRQVYPIHVPPKTADHITLQMTLSLLAVVRSGPLAASRCDRYRATLAPSTECAREGCSADDMVRFSARVTIHQRVPLMPADAPRGVVSITARTARRALPRFDDLKRAVARMLEEDALAAVRSA